jgi:hypothetical protein
LYPPGLCSPRVATPPSNHRQDGVNTGKSNHFLGNQSQSTLASVVVNLMLRSDVILIDQAY